MPLSLAPFQTTNAAGSFNIDSAGFIQGLTMDSPAIRNQLAGGVLAAPGTISAYPAGSPANVVGGMMITEFVPTGYVSGTAAGPKALGPIIMPATGVSGALAISGVTVFDQAHHMIQTVQSPVPVALPGMSVHYYRIGSRARVPLAIDPALISLQGGLTSAQVSWDFVSNRLVSYVAAYAANAITAASYNNGTGIATFTTTSAHGLVAGNTYSISGVTPAAYNGTFVAQSGTTGSTLTAQLATGLGLGNGTAFGTLVAGGGALPFKVLEIAPTNCMTVNTDSTTGFASWNRNGACALVEI